MDPYFQSMVKDWVTMGTSFLFMGWIIYLTAGLIRRRQQSVMQKHLLDKFATAQDFAEFIQSPAGQKYVTSFTDTVTSPRNSILSSVQWGIVLLALGPALITVSMRHNIWVFDLLGMSTTCLGIGFLVSAAVSYLLVKKAGLGEKE